MKSVLRKRISVLILSCLWFTGCVTTESGGLPEPAAKKDRVVAHLNLARGYLSQRQWGRAREPLERALRIDPQSVEAHVLMAVLNESEEDPKLAEVHYKTALRYGPKDAQALNNYGSFLFRNKRYAEAIEPLRRLVTDSSYHLRAQAYENLGLAELAVGHEDKAKDAFGRALTLNKGQTRSSLELASLEVSAGNMDLAKQHYENYRSNAKQTSRSLCIGLRISREVGDDNQVASHAIALRNLYPKSKRAKRCLAGEK